MPPSQSRPRGQADGLPDCLVSVCPFNCRQENVGRGTNHTLTYPHTVGLNVNRFRACSHLPARVRYPRSGLPHAPFQCVVMTDFPPIHESAQAPALACHSRKGSLVRKPRQFVIATKSNGS